MLDTGTPAWKYPATAQGLDGAIGAHTIYVGTLDGNLCAPTPGGRLLRAR